MWIELPYRGKRKGRGFLLEPTIAVMNGRIEEAKYNVCFQKAFDSGKSSRGLPRTRIVLQPSIMKGIERIIVLYH